MDNENTRIILATFPSVATELYFKGASYHDAAETCGVDLDWACSSARYLRDAHKLLVKPVRRPRRRSNKSRRNATLPSPPLDFAFWRWLWATDPLDAIEAAFCPLLQAAKILTDQGLSTWDKAELARQLEIPQDLERLWEDVYRLIEHSAHILDRVIVRRRTRSRRRNRPMI